MEEPPATLSFRSLERLCRQQSKLTTSPAVRRELERMELEYKRMADAQEKQSERKSVRAKPR